MVMDEHVTPLSLDMTYEVKHSNKSAIFKLQNNSDRFENIKKNIANYFGLPANQIFLKNSKDQILQDKERVIDELFPLQTARIVDEIPQVFVTFAKNQDTLKYILGDAMEQDMKQRQKEMAD